MTVVVVMASMCLRGSCFVDQQFADVRAAFVHFLAVVVACRREEKIVLVD